MFEYFLYYVWITDIFTIRRNFLFFCENLSICDEIYLKKRLFFQPAGHLIHTFIRLGFILLLKCEQEKVFESIFRSRMKEKLAVALFVLGAWFLLFPAKGGLGLSVACAAAEPALLSAAAHSSNQASCQTNRWSQHTDISLCLLRCDCNRCNPDTGAWHSVTTYCVYTARFTLTYFQEKKEEKGEGGVGLTLCTWSHTR